MRKDFTPNWTEEVFTISSVKATKPPTYTMKDTLGEPVQGTSYEQELQLSGTHNVKDEVDREERNCIRLAQQFGHLVEEYRVRFFTFQSPTQSEAAYFESYLLHVYYTSQLDNLHDDKEIDQLELDWITWQRDYAQNKTLEQVYSKQCNVNCKFSRI